MSIYSEAVLDEKRLVRVLKALADPKRLRMTQKIAAAGELSCGQVAAYFDLSQPTISHHLKILVGAGVLVCREAGQHRFISVDHDVIHDIADMLSARVGAARPPGARPRRVRQRQRA